MYNSNLWNFVTITTNVDVENLEIVLEVCLSLDIIE